MRSRFIIAIGAILLGLGMMFMSATSASATGDHKVTICHKGDTITIDYHAVNDHLWNHEGDYIGACKPTPTETVTETATATVTATATHTVNHTVEVTVPGPTTTITETPPCPTVTATETLPAETVTAWATETATSWATETLPAATVTATATSWATETATVTAPAETVTLPAEAVTATATETATVVNKITEPCTNNESLAYTGGGDPTPLGWAGLGLMLVGTIAAVLGYRKGGYKGAHE